MGFAFTCQEIVVDSSNQDYFDQLPDEIVLSIFTKLQDAKSLCLSMAVCKRFRSMAPQVDEISLSIPKKKKGSELRNPVARVLMKPFHFISQMVKSRSKHGENDLDFYSHYLHGEILKPFGEVRGLRLQLPCHGSKTLKPGKSSKNPRTFLKWTAEYGRDLHRCVILGAKSFTEKCGTPESAQESTPDEDLKMRIVWTISCLIASTARHYLIQETVKRRTTIQNVDVSDESNQGRLLMNKAQIEELRNGKGKGEEEVPESEPRSRVPPLRMKMWFVDRLDLGTKLMEGATLVVIRPAEAAAGGGGGGGDVLGFGDEVLEEAARKLMVAKTCYTLEMNSS